MISVLNIQDPVALDSRRSGRVSVFPRFRNRAVPEISAAGYMPNIYRVSQTMVWSPGLDPRTEPPYALRHILETVGAYWWQLGGPFSFLGRLDVDFEGPAVSTTMSFSSMVLQPRSSVVTNQPRGGIGC